MILFTRAAVADIIAIDSITAATWGQTQANRYLAFLSEVFSNIEGTPWIGSEVEGKPGYHVYLAKYRKRRSSHGHRIFYRQVEDGIEIIRVVHTAMSWPDLI